MTLTDPGPYRDAPGYDEAASLDEADPLRHHRERYINGDPDLIYLDGNSLGRLPVGAIEMLEEVTRHQWGNRLIRSWNEGWWDLQVELGDRLAPIVGAKPGEVIISDSTSVNLYKLAMAALMAAPGGRNRIVTDDLNFPSDLYVLDGIARQVGEELIIVPSDGVNGPLDGLSDAIDGTTALVSLSHTSYASGYTYDMEAVTSIAHDAGALVLWDCSHSVGVMPIDFEGAGVDLATGCTYKYLNGGPGSPAFLYVRASHQQEMTNPIAGWWGHAAPFDLDLEFTPVNGIRRFHTGTMPTLSLAAIEAGLDDVLDAGIAAIRTKSIALTEYLVAEFAEHLEPLGFSLASPADPERRGSHIAVSHEMAWPINLALIEKAKVIPDFRKPDIIRLGLSPLYTSFVDVHTAVQRVSAIVRSEAHLEFVGVSATVT